MPFKTPVKAKTIDVEIYDQEFFIDFGFASKIPYGSSVRRPGALLSVNKPQDDNFPAELRLDKNFATSEANIGMGADFSNKMISDMSVKQDTAAPTEVDAAVLVTTSRVFLLTRLNK